MLAAGASSRAGGVNKLLAMDQTGATMIARSVRAALGSNAEQVLVVLGHNRAMVAAALAQAGLEPHRRLTLLHAQAHLEGLAASLRCGIAGAAAACQADAALVCLGDMPMVRSATLDTLIQRAGEQATALACVPTLQARRGNPVLWRRDMFANLMALTGDRGGRALLDRRAGEVLDVPVDDPGILLDFDTPERLADYAASATTQETL
ncbi:nucleotidyltransferase family protein [Lichenicoccus sp.]|uniref:nucleotidyltransferase family protein n=1 Tax=Lichenicoccus sp. TaxID=2781899 RepID=UPI003D0F6DAB